MKKFEPITKEEFDLLWLRLNGQLADQGDVPNLFIDGSPCDQLYDCVTRARLRLAQRTGICFEDHDLLELISGLEEIGRLCAFQAANYLLRQHCPERSGKLYSFQP